MLLAEPLPQAKIAAVDLSICVPYSRVNISEGDLLIL